MPDIEKGKPVHCIEDVTGKQLAGSLLLSDDVIRTDLYSYHELVHVDAEAPIYLIAETGHVVSLHSSVDRGSGTRHSHDRAIYHQSLIANIAVIGYDRWTLSDKVKKVCFTVKHSMELLHNRDKVETLGSTRYPKVEDLRLFEDAADDMRLRASYGARYGMDFDAPKELWPSFEIEFDEPQNIHDYIRHVSNYVHFLSFCLGAKLKPGNIRIDRISRAETMAAIEADSYRGDYEVHYVWPEEEIASGELWVGGSPVRAWNDEELAALRACLVIWMVRADEWKKSYAMMMMSLSLRNVISAERLINACRWFEEIPIAQAQSVLPTHHVDAIAVTAAQKAQELGHSPKIQDRIAGAIRRLKAESSEEQFKRLVAMVEQKLGIGIMPENTVAHLKRAIQFRGKAAHGHFDPESDEEFRAFSKSTQAMEALCYLLTALNLPMSAEGTKRVRNHPLVQNYHLAYE
ncbi:hypothetical protein J1C56_16095 [Aminobacter anthyllidis]|uniref:ApeA N-terminal domain-containing protein n=1 Tax=Aminobacter anthyllidis TaxID=1035067 RepID=A0A9X1AC46_9HYPH|nr:hypothetical protein [Aminobacter anthyllidis]MBT1157118.1 hypothetical protein [Aminobacter anthyllidis]